MDTYISFLDTKMTQVIESLLLGLGKQGLAWWRYQMETFVNFPHRGQWRWDLMFYLICAWLNGWGNNGKACDLRHHRAHYDVTVMFILHSPYHCNCRWPADARSPGINCHDILKKRPLKLAVLPSHPWRLRIGPNQWNLPLSTCDK